MRKPSKERRPVDFKKVGKCLSHLAKVKRRLIETGERCGEQAYTYHSLEALQTYVRLIRQGLELQLRDGSLKDLPPETVQQAIYTCRILEGSLQVDTERKH